MVSRWSLGRNSEAAIRLAMNLAMNLVQIWWADEVSVKMSEAGPAGRRVCSWCEESCCSCICRLMLSARSRGFSMCPEWLAFNESFLNVFFYIFPNQAGMIGASTDLFLSSERVETMNHSRNALNLQSKASMASIAPEMWGHLYLHMRRPFAIFKKQQVARWHFQLPRIEWLDGRPCSCWCTPTQRHPTGETAGWMMMIWMSSTRMLWIRRESQRDAKWMSKKSCGCKSSRKCVINLACWSIFLVEIDRICIYIWLYMCICSYIISNYIHTYSPSMKFLLCKFHPFTFGEIALGRSRLQHALRDSKLNPRLRSRSCLNRNMAS